MLTRNTNDKSLYQESYPIKDDIKFRLVQFRSGLKIPFYGSMLEISGSRQWYRAFIQEEVLTNEYGILQAGAAYDYFRGWSFNTNWALNMVKKGLHSSINPAGGFYINTDISLENNDFIEGLNLSESGTLTEEFKQNNLIRIKLNGAYHFKIPHTTRQTITLKGDIGWINKNDIDSFFHFYLGGLPGLKGYPFYSIQGTKNFFLELSYRIPIFSEKHYKLKWITFQNSTIGAIAQVGNAWTEELFPFKESLGIQWRINGFSFYNFPTAIEVEYHRPLVKFERVINEEKFNYGNEGRTYVKILFDF